MDLLELLVQGVDDGFYLQRGRVLYRDYIHGIVKLILVRLRCLWATTFLYFEMVLDLLEELRVTIAIQVHQLEVVQLLLIDTFIPFF